MATSKSPTHECNFCFIVTHSMAVGRFSKNVFVSPSRIKRFSFFARFSRLKSDDIFPWLFFTRIMSWFDFSRCCNLSMMSRDYYFKFFSIQFLMFVLMISECFLDKIIKLWITIHQREVFSAVSLVTQCLRYIQKKKTHAEVKRKKCSKAHRGVVTTIQLKPAWNFNRKQYFPLMPIRKKEKKTT